MDSVKIAYAEVDDSRPQFGSIVLRDLDSGNVDRWQTIVS
jgi:hypothetical protein